MTGKNLDSTLGANPSLESVAKALSEQFPGNPQVAGLVKSLADAQSAEPKLAAMPSAANAELATTANTHFAGFGKTTSGSSESGSAIDAELAALLDKLGSSGKNRKPSSEDQKLAQIAFEVRRNGPSSPNLTAQNFSLFDRTTFRYRVLENSRRVGQ